MRIPNGERALVDVGKLRDYCLNSLHWRGRHKARVFAARLGLTAQDADLLRQALLDAARAGENAVLGEKDGFGQRYVLDFKGVGPAGSATVRSLWIVRANEDFPRLTSCYVL